MDMSSEESRATASGVCGCSERWDTAPEAVCDGQCVERGDEAGWGFCCLDDLELWQLHADRAGVEGGVGCRLFVLLALSRAVIECGSLRWPDSLCRNTVELSVAVCVEFPCCGWPFDSAG